MTLLVSVLNKIDSYLKTDDAKSKGFTSRPDIIYDSLREYFKNKLVLEPISLIGFSDHTIVLKENDTNLPVILSIGKDKILKCSVDKDPNCNHRNFCLQNETLWEFLKEHGAKVTRVRK